MNKTEIKKIDNKLKKLGEFTKDKKEFTENEIIDWISDCVTIFSEIGVNRVVIDDFLKFYTFGSKNLRGEQGNCAFARQENSDDKNHRSF